MKWFQVFRFFNCCTIFRKMRKREEYRDIERKWRFSSLSKSSQLYLHANKSNLQNFFFFFNEIAIRTFFSTSATYYKMQNHYTLFFFFLLSFIPKMTLSAEFDDLKKSKLIVGLHGLPELAALQRH